MSFPPRYRGSDDKALSIHSFEFDRMKPPRRNHEVLSSLHRCQTPSPIISSPRLSPYCVNNPTRIAIDKNCIVFITMDNSQIIIKSWFRPAQLLLLSFPLQQYTARRPQVFNLEYHHTTTPPPPPLTTTMARTRSAAHMRLLKKKRTR